MASLFLGYNGFAQETDLKEGISETMHFKDPFQSQLPIREIALPILGVKVEVKPIQKAEEVINPPMLNITGLVWGASRPQAIINDQVVDIGNVIEDATIININKSGVDISYRGKRFTLDPNKQVNNQKMAQLNRNLPVNFEQSQFDR